MRRDSVTAKFFAWGLIFVFALLGCRAAVKPTPEQEPAGIHYNITQEAKLTKVTLYEGQKGFWWVDVSLKNVTDKQQAFRVSAKVDDEGSVASFTGGSKRSALAPQKEGIVKLKTLSKKLPKILTITIIPYP
jgi:hypothetical protein